MNKQKWIEEAYQEFVKRGVKEGKSTKDWAELCYQVEEQNYQEAGFDFRDPYEAVKDELDAAAESQ